MNRPAHSVFISHASADSGVARALTAGLERLGLSCWLAPRDVDAGAEWSDAIVEAISSSKAVVVILSGKSNSSFVVYREVAYADSHRIPLFAFMPEPVLQSRSLHLLLQGVHIVDGSVADLDGSAQELVAAIRRHLPDAVDVVQSASITTATREDKSKGYVFISYVRNDSAFVQKLRGIFESKRYGYWDYVIGDRDYHGALYRELEERIDGAVAFMSAVSDDWRKSDWVASEFIYAREAKIPIFVVQAKPLTRAFPILLNLQTRIDMSSDFEYGARVLAEELAKKGL